jgi:hypothetical protein
MITRKTNPGADSTQEKRMYDLKFRTPVVCQNGHKAFWYWEIKGRNIGAGEVKQIGVISNRCSCPKGALGEGYARDGEDEMFTDLRDKDTGVEIYEGDIVTAAWHWTEPHIIKLPDDFYSFSEFSLGDMLTIIGNVHNIPKPIKA